MAQQLVAGGKEHIAVEVDTIGAGVDKAIGDPQLFQLEGFVGDIGIIGIHLALDQCLQIKGGGHQIELIEADALFGEGSQQLYAFT